METRETWAWFFAIAMTVATAIFIGLWLAVPSPLKKVPKTCPFIGQTPGNCSTCQPGYEESAFGLKDCRQCAEGYMQDGTYFSVDNQIKCVKDPNYVVPELPQCAEGYILDPDTMYTDNPQCIPDIPPISN